MRFMLDTDMCVYLIKKRPAKVFRRLRQTEISDVAISCVTLSELEYGAAKSAKPEQNRAALRNFVAPIDVLDYDTRAARIYGGLRAHLERQGNPIGAMDCLIAAHALSLDYTLVTNNETEFNRMPGLRVKNWAR